MSRRRVLIIDDEDDIREVAKASLEVTSAWEVLTAGSGTEGVQLAASQKPDAILLDYMMPIMDGLVTFQKLQELPATRGIPVILLTASKQPSDLQRFAQLGFAAVMEKPFDPLTLTSEISRVMGWN